jgi:hypothetical protein
MQALASPLRRHSTATFGPGWLVGYIAHASRLSSTESVDKAVDNFVNFASPQAALKSCVVWVNDSTKPKITA